MLQLPVMSSKNQCRGPFSSTNEPRDWLYRPKYEQSQQLSHHCQQLSTSTCMACTLLTKGRVFKGNTQPQCKSNKCMQCETIVSE